MTKLYNISSDTVGSGMVELRVQVEPVEFGHTSDFNVIIRPNGGILINSSLLATLYARNGKWGFFAKIGRTNFYSWAELENEIIEHNLNDPRNELEARVNHRNLRIIEILSDLS